MRISRTITSKKKKSLEEVHFFFSHIFTFLFILKDTRGNAEKTATVNN